MKVLHVEAGRHLAGGPRQVLYLLEALHDEPVDNLLVCPEDSAIARAARQQGEQVRTVPMRGDLDLALIPRLRRVIRRERPHIVHLHSRRGASVQGALAARGTGARTVLTRRVVSSPPRLVAKLQYRLYDRVVAISAGVREVLLSAGVEPQRVVCVHSAVDAERFRSPYARAWFEAQFGVPADAPLLGTVARLVEEKGHPHLLRAMPAVLERFPAARLVLFGAGPREARLREEIARLGLAGRVILAGFRSDMDHIVGSLDLVVHPALREGLGVALLEAAAAARPIVASAAGGIPEIVRDGETGLLVPPGDSRALAVAVCRLLEHPGLARALGQQARARAEAAFSVAAMARGYLAVYTELAGG